MTMNQRTTIPFMTFLLLLGCFGASRVRAQSTDTDNIRVEGAVTQPLRLSARDLAAMPHSTVSAKDRNGQAHEYTGVPVAAILSRAGVTMGPQLRGVNLAKYLLVTSSDGYQVVFSLAELDSSFTDRVVILADQMEGKPLAATVGPFRIIVPGEKKPARSSFKVISFTIRTAKD
jgi:DMSO/TMAO reductase YedYZ molybdopterin-dependent catalytic subunit